MELKRVKHYVRRVLQLGPQKSLLLLRVRIKNKAFEKYWRTKAVNKTAAHSWKSVFKKYSHTYDDFNHYWAAQQQRLDLSVDALKITVSNEQIIQEAQDYCANIFSILGSSKKAYQTIPWHEDIRLKEQAPTGDLTFNAVFYYKDVAITSGTASVVKDIKVPWELSRLQHFFVLGHAYITTNNEDFAKTFVAQYKDWLNNNSFLLGANWSCPMDVGIRAVNLVWALSLFKKSSTLSQEFLQKTIASLYDHFFYLENNWELYDLRTSNHYLSDLIGYFYLCYFFHGMSGIEQKTAWCYQELLREFKKQVFDEGTDYEGSTAYHGLVTEIFYHFYLLGQKMGFVFEPAFIDKLAKMFSFIDWCTSHKGSSIVRVGDDDSGKLLYYGLSKNLILSMKTPESVQQKHFKEFGLSIVKTPRLHYTLRHHVFNQRQPSGHFHNDVGSITLSLDGIAIFVDPGSYLYTPSVLWRNKFRSIEAHNSFYIRGYEPIGFDERLFFLNLPEQQFLPEWESSNLWTLQTNHTLYKNKRSMTASRTISYESESAVISIIDTWHHMQGKDPDILGCWNFTINPCLEVQQEEKGFIFCYQKKPLAQFQSDLLFELKDGFVAPAYGTKIACKQLRSMVTIMHNDPVITRITVF